MNQGNGLNKNTALKRERCMGGVMGVI